MIKSRSVYIGTVLLQIVFVLVAVSLCGCGKSAAGSSRLQLSTTRQDDVFQNGADRPPSLRTLYAMSDIFAMQGRDAQAESVLVRIIREYPEFTPAYNSLAELRMRQRRIDEAITTLSQGLEVDSADPVIMNNLGMCWMIKRDYEKALKMFTGAAGLQPGNTRYRSNMAVALGFLGRDEESLALYRQILPEDQANRNLEIIRIARDKNSVENLMSTESSGSR